MILLPEDFMPEDFKTGIVKNITGALGRGAVAKDAPLLCLELTGEDGKTAVASLVWPATRANSIPLNATHCSNGRGAAVGS